MALKAGVSNEDTLNKNSATIKKVKAEEKKKNEFLSATRESQRLHSTAADGDLIESSAEDPSPQQPEAQAVQ